MTARVLVAGLGNIFLGDDGFGVEVARRLTVEGDLPAGTEVGDFGIRGVHLAYELMSGYDTAILVDATSRGGPPGTVYALDLSPTPEVTPALAPGAPSDTSALTVSPTARPPTAPSPAVDAAPEVLLDAHGMQPDAVLALLRRMGAEVGRVLLVGCEPADLGDGIGLSPPVAAAVDEAMLLVRTLAAEATAPPRDQTAADAVTPHRSPGAASGDLTRGGVR
ncbi:hydrogenase maturation protease [Longispora sp. K20-0274]|uniref:hydrogenase maturation protease n=1 Tax=Longispora sp. K20-0274 TaxID=3088255 RepID=UPI00399AC70E